MGGMTLNEFRDRAHETAKKKGWWDKPISGLQFHALVHSEIAEATEAVRSPSKHIYQHWQHESTVQQDGEGIEFRGKRYTVEQFVDLCHVPPGDPRWDEYGKPEGHAVELADAMIRIADWFGRHGWDLEEIIRIKMEYNETRPYRHGKAL